MLRDVISSLALCDMPTFSVPRRYSRNPFSAKVLRFRWQDAETVPSVTKPGVSITRRDFLPRTSESFGSRRYNRTPCSQIPLDQEEVCLCVCVGGGGGGGGGFTSTFTQLLGFELELCESRYGRPGLPCP